MAPPSCREPRQSMLLGLLFLRAMLMSAAPMVAKIMDFKSMRKLHFYETDMLILNNNMVFIAASIICLKFWPL